MITNLLSLIGFSALLPTQAHASSPTAIELPADVQVDPWSDTSREFVVTSNDPTIKELLTSAQANSMISFYYFGGSTPRRLRKVRVDHVFRVSTTSHTYVRAYCQLREDYRIFRADKIALA